MRITWLIRTVMILSAFLMAQSAAASGGPGRFYVMTAIENHSGIRGADGSFGSETYQNTMLSLSKKLQDGVYGSVYYLASFSIDEGDVARHAAGASVVRAFTPRLLVSVAYSFTSNPERGVIVARPRTDHERFSSRMIYNFNPGDKDNARYTATTGYSTITNFGEQQTISEKLGVRIPLSERYTGKLNYKYTYSLAESEQMTNQFGASLIYRRTKHRKVTLDVLHVDNVYGGGADDDTIFRLSMLSLVN